MDYFQAAELLKRHNQSQLLEYYDCLSEGERKILLDDIAKIDFDIIESSEKERKTGRLSPAVAVTIGDIEAHREKFLREGLKALRAGKAAAVLLAGGQGSRLGTSEPKGMYDMGLTRELSIFECQWRDIRRTAELCGRPFHVFVMTSSANCDITRNFFAEKKFFGYPADMVHFYVQSEAPSCDLNGKIFLGERHRVAFNPNGNGGWYSSLAASGCASILESEGIEWLNVYAVDNVLQRICDPVFIGATILSGCGCGAKVVKKVGAEENVGVLCRSDGKPTIVEYYDMPDDIKRLTDKNGELVYKYGVILNYLFPVEKLRQTADCRLPYHRALKAIPHLEGGVRVTPKEKNGYKFETLVVDMIERMGSCLAFEVERGREFAPVKNRTGADSVDTARALLKENGVVL